MSKITSRPWNASKEINELEHRWWEENADILARVWEMTDPLSLAIRSNYLQRAKTFFLQGLTQSTVLELGCGSGWVGQFISDQNLRIIGTDFAKSQIEIATANAAKRGVSQWCKYAVQDDKEIPDQIIDVTGVLLHCFLHHLDGSELESLLAKLVEKSRPGTRFFVHEPAFYAHSNAPVQEDPLSSIYYDVAIKLHACVSDSLIKNGLIDAAAKNRFDMLAKQAEQNNWYLSPKEVPFDITEFTNILSKFFHVRSHYWSNIYIIGWVFEINLVTDPNVRKALEGGVVPMLAAFDDFLSRDEGFLRRTMVPPGYAFHVWECESKGTVEKL